ncbi:hypothetical protein SAMD00019534_049610, partial [Acytostelium subglobosum LB1]|uniref:hypothetical protein n=1 Tax=Acytostelium subglobosum LB1 TaxID=1410327 RepID=UPI000644DE25
SISINPSTSLTSSSSISSTSKFNKLVCQPTNFTYLGSLITYLFNHHQSLPISIINFIPTLPSPSPASQPASKPKIASKPASLDQPISNIVQYVIDAPVVVWLYKLGLFNTCLSLPPSTVCTNNT